MEWWRGPAAVISQQIVGDHHCRKQANLGATNSLEKEQKEVVDPPDLTGLDMSQNLKQAICSHSGTFGYR